MTKLVPPKIVSHAASYERLNIMPLRYAQKITKILNDSEMGKNRVLFMGVWANAWGGRNFEVSPKSFCTRSKSLFLALKIGTSSS